MPLTPSGEWTSSDQYDDIQWDDSGDNASFGSYVSSTSYTLSYDVLKYIISVPEHKTPSITFADYVAFTKDTTDNEILFDIPKLDTRKLDSYDGLSTSPAVYPFGPNYIYDTIHHLISRSSSINTTIPPAYTIASLVRYCINGLSIRNRHICVKKLCKLFLFKPDNILMKTLEATTQLIGFNKRLPMRQSNKRFPYSRPHQHEDDVIDTFFSLVKSHVGTTAVEIIVGTKTLLMDVYAIGYKSGLNISKFLQDQFSERGIPINIWSDKEK